MPGQPPSSEPDLLNRLRRAVQVTGLAAGLTSRPHAALVTSRLAQTAVEHLQRLNPRAGQDLVAELRNLAGPEETALFTQGRGYTFFHAIQFVYEYAGRHDGLRSPCAFCIGVGRNGGGLNIRPETDIVSLVRLLIAALPAGADRRNIGLLVRALAPMMLDKVFPTRDFRIVVSPDGEDRLRVTLRYASRRRMVETLEAFGLGGETGRFFRNAALQIQGTFDLGLRTFAQGVGRSLRLEGPIERRSVGEREEVERACACAWDIAWEPDLRLRRLTAPEGVLAQVRTIYETLHRRDLEYFQERVRTLEMRVKALEEGDRFHDLIGKSPQMRQVYRLIGQVAASDLSVLILGESGTGKELVARAIHESGPRRDRPFVAVNCAALSETLLESELFGHEKGAFTGADRTRPGRFETADGGTLFLDEVGDIPMITQVKLLRVLETKSFERVGGTPTRHADVRIVAATHRNLEDLIAKGQFREDLYFRLNVLPVSLPPLRDHREDIPLLAQAFLERIGLRSGRPLRGLSRGAVQRLMNHAWPGNIRELKNVIERAVAVYAQGAALSESDIAQALGVRTPPASPLNLRQQRILEAVPEAGCTVEDLLPLLDPKAHGGNSRRTLQNDLRRLADLGLLTYRKQGSARRYAAASGQKE